MVDGIGSSGMAHQQSHHQQVGVIWISRLVQVRSESRRHTRWRRGRMSVVRTACRPLLRAVLVARFLGLGLGLGIDVESVQVSQERLAVVVNGDAAGRDVLVDIHLARDPRRLPETSAALVPAINHAVRVYRPAGVLPLAIRRWKGAGRLVVAQRTRVRDSRWRELNAGNGPGCHMACRGVAVRSVDGSTGV